MVMISLVSFLLLAPPLPPEVERCVRALSEKRDGKRDLRARSGRCAEAFKQPVCASAIRDASKRKDARWPSQAVQTCCDAYLKIFEARHFLERPPLCDANRAIGDRAEAVRGWSDFTTSAFIVDWSMDTAEAMLAAERFAGSLVPDPLELPEDVRAPTIQVSIVLMKIPADAPLVAIVNDPRTPVPSSVKITRTGDWAALVKAVEAIAPKVRAVVSLSQGASKAELQQAESALSKAGIPTTVE